MCTTMIKESMLLKWSYAWIGGGDKTTAQDLSNEPKTMAQG